jgi:hypothetical protein
MCSLHHRNFAHIPFDIRADGEAARMFAPEFHLVKVHGYSRDPVPSVGGIILEMEVAQGVSLFEQERGGFSERQPAKQKPCGTTDGA